MSVFIWTDEEAADYIAEQRAEAVRTALDALRERVEGLPEVDADIMVDIDVYQARAGLVDVELVLRLIDEARPK